MNVDRDIREQSYQLFLTEAPDLLQQVDEGLRELGRDPTPATIHGLMRATHTLKGAAANVGRDPLKRLAHDLETIFRALLFPDAPLDRGIERLLFESVQCLHLAFSAELSGEDVSAAVLQRAERFFEQLRDRLAAFVDREPPMPSSSDLGFDMTRSIFEVGVKQRLDEIAQAIAAEDGTQAAETLHAHAEVFVGLAESLGLPGFQELATTALAALAAQPQRGLEVARCALSDLERAREAVLAGDRESGGSPSAALRRFAGGDTSESSAIAAVERVRGTVGCDGGAGGSRGRNGDASALQPPESSARPTELSARTRADLAEPSRDPDLETRAVASDIAPPPTKGPVRVEVDQLERLNHLAGELAIDQNQLALRDDQLRAAVSKLQTWLQRHRNTLGTLRELLPTSEEDSPRAQHLFAAIEEHAQLTQAADDLNLFSRSATANVERELRLSKQLRDSLEAMRMVRVERILERFPATIAQLAHLYGKPAELTLDGTQVTVDKSISSNLYDALLHLVRNAFDHGIEPPEERTRAGKPAIGRIHIRAYTQGNRTTIEVGDDGRGLDIDEICRRARDKGLLSAAQIADITRQERPESKLLRVLCEPGFSTTDRATDLSGRGVGLDVVYSQLAAIDGAVAVATELGKGTTFSLHIRGALMNARLLVCRSRERSYAFVSDEIEQVLMPRAEQLRYLGSQRVFQWQPQGTSDTVALPIHELGALFAYQPSLQQAHLPPAAASLLSAEDDIAPVLLLKTPDGYVGLQVDAILEEQELVIKPVPAVIATPPYVYGCTILADGQLALTIDGAALVQFARRRLPSPPAAAPPPRSPAIPPRNANPLLLDATNPYSIHIGEAAVHDELTGRATPAALPAVAERVVLVIDDSMTERHTLTSILQRGNYAVLEASDGMEALELLKSQHSAVSAILCDLEMPRMNGLEFLGALQQDATLSEIPVTILTSRARDKYQRIALELGARDYLTKPYLDRDLLDAIERLLS